MRLISRLSLVAAPSFAVLLLAATPSVADTPRVIIESPPYLADADGRSAYGLYLAGRSALSQGRTQMAVDYLAAVQDLAQDQTRVREQAFTSALLAGRLETAARLAPEGDASPVVVEAGRLVRAVEIYRGGDARAAHAELTAAPVQAPHTRAGLFLAPWIAAEARDWDRALALPPAGADPGSAALLRFNRAMLMEIGRRNDEADAAYGQLVAAAPDTALFRAAYGAFLERQGRRDEARAVYRAEGHDAGRVGEALARMEAGGRPSPLPTLREGAANALAAAAAFATNEGGQEFGVVYYRLSLALNDDDGVRAALAQALGQARLQRASRETYAQIGAEDPSLFVAARLATAESLQDDDDLDAALAEVLRAHEVAPDDARVAYALAAVRLAREEYELALEVLNGPILNIEGQGPEVQFMRGAAFESLERVPEAEAELWAAMQQAPENAHILNYLGYLWVDRGLRVDQGAELIARAFEAAPEDGNIQDSLGWAQYRQGQFEAAVETLEAAVAKEPANAEINGHLGDAYWRVGRRREAEFQWARVLTLEPDAEERAAAEAKLARGLDAVETAAAGLNR